MANFKILKINKIEMDAKIDFIGKYPQDVTGYTIWCWNYSSKKRCLLEKHKICLFLQIF